VQCSADLDFLQLGILVILKVVHFLFQTFTIGQSNLLLLLGAIDDFFSFSQRLASCFDLCNDLSDQLPSIGQVSAYLGSITTSDLLFQQLDLVLPNVQFTLILPESIDHLFRIGQFP